MPISTKPGSIGVGEYGLTRGTCFIARRAEVVAIAELLWIAWCVLGAAGFRVSFVVVFLSSNAHGLLHVGGRLVSFTYLLVARKLSANRTKTSLHNKAVLCP